MYVYNNKYHLFVNKVNILYMYVYSNTCICDRTCRNQPYRAICNFSLQAILSLGGCFGVLFIFLTKTLWNICTKFHRRRSFLSAIKYRCIAYNLYVWKTSHGKLAIRVSGNLVDTMRYHGCRNFSRENELIVRIPSI